METKRLRVLQDDSPCSPREWDNLGTMVCSHRRYNLGDEQDFEPEYAGNWGDHTAEYFSQESGIDIDPDNYQESVEKILNWVADNVVLNNLYLYDHSGITISSSPFSCRWDSGQLGFHYCTLKQAIENWSLPKDSTWDTTIEEWYGENKGEQVSLRTVVERMLEGEVETYDQYLRGDVYRFVVEEWDPTPGVGWVHLDSCGGFYGDDFKENGMLDHLPEGMEALLDEVEIEY